MCVLIFSATFLILRRTEWDMIKHVYRVIHKFVKHFKNSQQINYSTDHGSSYADRERNSPTFFTYFTDAQCVHLWQCGRHLCDSPSRCTHVSAYHGRPEPQQRRYGCENLEISGEWRHKDSVSFTNRQKKSRTGLNPVTGVATALTRHLLFLSVLSTFVASFDWDTLARLWSDPESRLVERCNHYCLHSTVASASFLTCFMDLWTTLYSS